MAQVDNPTPRAFSFPEGERKGHTNTLVSVHERLESLIGRKYPSSQLWSSSSLTLPNQIPRNLCLEHLRRARWGIASSGRSRLRRRHARQQQLRARIRQRQKGHNRETHGLADSGRLDSQAESRREGAGRTRFRLRFAARIADCCRKGHPVLGALLSGGPRTRVEALICFSFPRQAKRLLRRTVIRR